jgi:hypothetical protein
MLDDPEYRAEATRIHLRVLPTDGETLAAAIRASIDRADAALIERARALVMPK